jgi:hypothetical protein
VDERSKVLRKLVKVNFGFLKEPVYIHVSSESPLLYTLDDFKIKIKKELSSMLLEEGVEIKECGDLRLTAGEEMIRDTQDLEYVFQGESLVIDVEIFPKSREIVDYF